MDNDPPVISEYASVFNISADDEVWIDSLLDKMTIRERVAQMIMPWAGGNYISESSSEYKRLKYLAEDLKVGGFIFFKGDILNEALTINKLQQLSSVPLLISSDFERGLAMRLIDATEFPYNMALAATGDLDLAREMGKIISLESRAIGVHQNYAPVADINTNAENPIINIRAYSDNKDVVSKYGEAFIRGSITGNVLTTAKHFPGHGSTITDSHKELPLISSSRDELMKNELAPFIHLIRSGVHSVMIGHLSVPSLEPEKLPATLSKRIITDLLKEELGFRGLIVTDAMNMNAVTKNFSVAQASVMAVKAGNDIILMPPDEDIAILSISNAVYSGEIPIERINESVRKILAAKKWLQLDKERTTDITKLPEFVGSKKNVFTAKEIAEKSITLVKNDINLIPLNPSDYYSTAVISISDIAGTGSAFNDLVDQEFGYIKTISLNRKSSDKDYSRALEIARTSDLILLPSYVRARAYQGTVKLNEKQSKFMNSVLKMNKPSVVISLGNPYLLSLFPQAKTYITSYGDAAVSQTAILRAITGKADITGKLPINISGTEHNIGSGISVKRNLLTLDNEKWDFPQTEKILLNALHEKIYPAVSISASYRGKLIYSRSFGRSDFDENSPIVNSDFLFDIDEVTALYTTACALVLISEFILDFNKRVSDIIPETRDKSILVKDLLFRNNDTNSGGEFILAAAKNSYSNKFILLQKVLEKTSGVSIDNLVRQKIITPLSLKNTMYNPPRESWFFTLPTSEDINPRKRNKGVVYDGEAFHNAGVSGNAGIFTTTEDMSIFLQMLIQGGRYSDKELINETVINSWISGNSDEIFISGKTGTAVWINFPKQLSVVLFTNSSYSGRTADLEKAYETIYSSVKKTLK